MFNQRAAVPGTARESIMSNKASDTLAIARSLKAAGVEAEKADAFVEAMVRSTGKFVTVEHFDGAVERLDTRIDGLQAHFDAAIARLAARMDGLEARIDAVRTEMQAGINAVRADLRADIARSILIAVGVLIAANALMMTLLGIVLTSGTPTT